MAPLLFEMGLMANYISSKTVYKYPLNSIVLHIKQHSQNVSSEVLNASTNWTPDTRSEAESESISSCQEISVYNFPFPGVYCCFVHSLAVSKQMAGSLSCDAELSPWRYVLN